MIERSYIGIDITDNNEWIVGFWENGKAIFSRPFKNTATELEALVRFITERCAKPKICLKPKNPAALKLIKTIGGIPAVEVVLMSDAGLKLHLAFLPKSLAASGFQNHACQASLLAYCAERIP
jgi:hypothetical protein